MDGEISYIKAIHDQVDANNEIMSKLAGRTKTPKKGAARHYPEMGAKFTMIEGPKGDDGPCITYIVAPGCKSLPIEEIIEGSLKTKHIRVLLPRASTDVDLMDTGPWKVLIKKGSNKLSKEKDLFVDVQSYGVASPCTCQS